MSEQSLTPAPEPASTPSTTTGPRWFCTPPIDIYETDAGLVLQADLPGVAPDQLELQVQDNRLTLMGRVAPQAPENARLIYQEYRVGDYLRSFILSEDVDHDRIAAKFSDGVLQVTLPRTIKPEPRRIQIRAE
jgi:HSP20 family molecular chaperone IbpA